MGTVVIILVFIFAVIAVPFAAILGLLGFWVAGFWGALIGVIVGLSIQGSN